MRSRYGSSSSTGTRSSRPPATCWPPAGPDRAGPRPIRPRRLQCRRPSPSPRRGSRAPRRRRGACTGWPRGCGCAATGRPPSARRSPGRTATSSPSSSPPCRCGRRRPSASGPAGSRASCWTGMRPPSPSSPGACLRGGPTRPPSAACVSFCAMCSPGCARVRTWRPSSRMRTGSAGTPTSCSSSTASATTWRTRSPPEAGSRSWRRSAGRTSPWPRGRRRKTRRRDLPPGSGPAPRATASTGRSTRPACWTRTPAPSSGAPTTAS